MPNNKLLNVNLVAEVDEALRRQERVQSFVGDVRNNGWAISKGAFKVTLEGAPGPFNSALEQAIRENSQDLLERAAELIDEDMDNLLDSLETNINEAKTKIPAFRSLGTK